MEKKKLKLSISGSSKKTFNSIEQAKTQSKNAVFIEKKAGRILRKSNINKPHKLNFSPKIQNNSSLNKVMQTDLKSTKSDFEKRKLAEQRATKRLKGEIAPKDINKKKLIQVKES